MEIIQVLSVTPEQLNDINLLLEEQSPGARDNVSVDEIRQILSDPTFYLFVARDGEKIAGMASFFVRRNLARWMAEIHDVVVSQEYRGQGLGKQLTLALLAELRKIAHQEGTKIKLYLTSRPSREVANLMYRKLGFTLVAEASGEWGTNLFKMIITPD